jgi:hypothetical protein
MLRLDPILRVTLAHHAPSRAVSLRTARQKMPQRKCLKINWQFGTDLAWVKLKRLYPPMEQPENTLGQEASSPVKISASDH